MPQANCGLVFFLTVKPHPWTSFSRTGWKRRRGIVFDSSFATIMLVRQCLCWSQCSAISQRFTSPGLDFARLFIGLFCRSQHRYPHKQQEVIISSVRWVVPLSTKCGVIYFHSRLDKSSFLTSSFSPQCSFSCCQFVWC